MDKKLDCEIVRDLLPSYADRLTSNATNKAVEEHLTECVDCSAVLRRMKEPEPQGGTPAAEVDYLKKVRRHTKYISLFIGIGLMLLGLAIVSLRIFYVGSEVNAAEVYYNVTVTDNTLHISGTLTSSGLGVSRVKFSDSNGIVRLKVYTAPKMFFNNGEFSEYYTALNKVQQIRIDDLIIWENGRPIDSVTAQLYAAKNPYIGDMPSNGRIASVLGISDQFSSYTNELQTSDEPYGWALIIETRISQEEERAARDIMTADSYAMLAVIENLDHVTWRYDTEAGQQEYTVTAAEASAYAGKDIKLCSSSVSELQMLMQSLSIKWSGMREVLQEDGTFFLKIRNDSDDEIYGMAIKYYLDGELIGGCGFGNADNTALTAESEASFEFIPEDFPDGTSAIALSGFSFDLAVIGSDGAETVVCEKQPVSAKYAWTFFYTLAGNFKNGFVLNEG